MRKNNYLKLSKTQILDQIKLMADQTDRLLLAQKIIMNLEQQLFHEKWKYRHVSRSLKNIAKKLGQPDLAISEEELDEQIRGKEN